MWDFSFVAYKDTKTETKVNEGDSGQNGFRENLSISPLLSVSSLLFFCFSTVLRECTALNKSAMLQITTFVVSLTCEGTS